MRQRWTASLAACLLLQGGVTEIVAQEGWDRPVVLLPTNVPAIRTIKDVPYAGVAASERMDVYLPSVPGGSSLPFVVFVHGGPVPRDLPISVKDMALFRGYAHLLAVRGVATVAFAHGFSNLSEIERSADRIATALEFVLSRAEDWGLSRSRFCVWTVSAGGLFASPFLSPLDDAPRCVVMYYPLLDMAAYPELGLGQPPPRLTGRFRTTWADGRSPPVLLARAGEDWAALNREIDRFVSEALAANAELTVLNHPTGVHGFDTFTDDDLSRAIILQTLDFVERALSPR